MLAVIVINYKSEKKTIDFVKTELLKITIPHMTVVVNNGSSDKSDAILVNALNAALVKRAERASNLCKRDCYVISNEENSGFAKGNNLGAEFVRNNFKCEYFLFTNNDIRLIDSDACEVLIDTLKQHPEVGLIGPQVIGLMGEKQSPEPYTSFGQRYIWPYLCTPFVSKKWKTKHFQFDYAKNAKEGYHYKVMGSFFLMRSKDFFDCGMMDDHTFLYAEETILSERLKAIGLNVYYQPKVKVLHEHGTTTSKCLKRREQSEIRFASDAYYYKTYKGTSKLVIKIGWIVNWFMCHLKK